MSNALRLYFNRQLLKTEEFRDQAEWEASLGDTYTIKREQNEDGTTMLVAYDEAGRMLGSFVLDDSGRGAGVNVEGRVFEAAYRPEDAATFKRAIYKVAGVLDVSWKDVYYRFTLDPEYYSSSYDEEAMLDAEYGLGISDAATLSDQVTALQDVYGLDDNEVEALLATEKHWQNQFNNEGNENAD
jgi:hypothetical protein